VGLPLCALLQVLRNAFEQLKRLFLSRLVLAFQFTLRDSHSDFAPLARRVRDGRRTRRCAHVLGDDLHILGEFTEEPVWLAEHLIATAEHRIAKTKIAHCPGAAAHAPSAAAVGLVTE